MKIILADQYGFCMGVKRAVRITTELADKEKPLTIYHEIVHNETIVDFFKSKGVAQARTIDAIPGGTVIIPAHGAPPEIIERAEKMGLRIIDATCPLVKRIHRLVERLIDDGYNIIHFGDKGHDETVGIAGHAGSKITIIESIEDAKKLDLKSGKFALIAQTTAGLDEFERIARFLKQKYPHLEVYNTICNATIRRQKAAAELAANCDLFLVVGSEGSANTGRLLEIASARCPGSFRINGPEELRNEWFFRNSRPLQTIGITAGASTPDSTVEKIIVRIKEIVPEPVEIVAPDHRDTDPSLVFEQ